jgi:hypothetical protein
VPSLIVDKLDKQEFKLLANITQSLCAKLSIHGIAKVLELSIPKFGI